MKKQLIILMSIWTLLIVSCQKEDIDLPIDDPSLSSEGVPVDISFSILGNLETGSAIEPMDLNGETRAGDPIKVVISNKIKVILAKEVNGQWILDDFFDYKIDPTEKWTPIYHKVTDDSKFDPINMILRPGKYKVTLITGSNSLNWNRELRKGDILNEGENAQWVCTYRMADRELHQGKPSLQEEIFSTVKEFEVKKTDDLHSTVYNNNVSLTLKRKVARLRILLKKRTTGNMDPLTILDFQTGVINGIVAKLDLTDSNQKFSNGLNVWGELEYSHYNKPEYASTLYFGVFTSGEYYTGNDGNKYMLGMRSQRQCGQYFFVETDQELPVKISDVMVTGDTYFPAYVYDNIEGISLKHNTISGVIFESGDKEWPGDSRIYRNLLLVEEDGAPAKSETKFNNYYEYFD